MRRRYIYQGRKICRFACPVAAAAAQVQCGLIPRTADSDAMAVTRPGAGRPRERGPAAPIATGGAASTGGDARAVRSRERMRPKLTSAGRGMAPTAETAQARRAATASITGPGGSRAAAEWARHDATVPALLKEAATHYCSPCKHSRDSSAPSALLRHPSAAPAARSRITRAAAGRACGAARAEQCPDPGGFATPRWCARAR